MKVLVGAFNQDTALVGSFSVIVKSLRKFVESSSRERSVCLCPAVVAVSGWRCDRDRRTDRQVVM